MLLRARVSLLRGQMAFASGHSADTVEWHLRKVFTKLGIGSRRELSSALANLDGPALRA